MQCVQVVARGKAEFVEAARPEMRPGHVLVRPTHLSLCGSDIRMLHFAPEAAYPFPPGTTGHEVVGTVVALEEPDAELAIGDDVLALAPGHEAMAEYYLAPRRFVLPLPQGHPPEVLLQAQQLGTVLYAAQRLPNLVGKSVAVIGQGSAGLWFNHVVRRLGARQVVAIDQDPNRLLRSVDFGATATVLVHPPSGAEGQPCRIQSVAAPDAAEPVIADPDAWQADLVIEAAGTAAAVNLAFRKVKRFGQVMLFGVPQGQFFSIDMESFFFKCCQATTIVGASEEPDQASTRMALQWIAQEPGLAASMITHRLPFSDVLQAYEMHRLRSDGCLKIVIQL